jgi:hypothetical protein
MPNVLVYWRQPKARQIVELSSVRLSQLVTKKRVATSLEQVGDFHKVAEGIPTAINAHFAIITSRLVITADRQRWYRDHLFSNRQWSGSTLGSEVVGPLLALTQRKM